MRKDQANSWQTVYYIRLLDLYPEEPLFQLLAGVAFLLRSTQRQTDNKHYMIAQAMACFSQYRKHRGKPAEANYNFGRAFHQMCTSLLHPFATVYCLTMQRTALRSLAIKHYEAVLSEERQRLEEGLEPLEGGLAKYAAYNLYQIFLSSGLRAPAQNVVDEWLTM